MSIRNSSGYADGLISPGIPQGSDALDIFSDPIAKARSFRTVAFSLLSRFFHKSKAKEVKMKKELFLLAFVLSALVYSEVLYTFQTSYVEVRSGQDENDGFVSLYQEVDINEPFAVALNWKINTFTGHRYYSNSWYVFATALNYGDHADGGGGGYNRTGKKMTIYREATQTGYSYFSEILTVYDNKGCIHSTE